MVLTEVIQMVDLHARKLTLTHPVSKEIITFSAEVPKNIIWQSITT